MKVYTITREDFGYGYTTPEIDNVMIEAEVELDEWGDDPKTEFTRDNLPKFREAVEALEVLEPDESGMCLVSFGPFRITVGEMSEEVYKALPEFSGW